MERNREKLQTDEEEEEAKIAERDKEEEEERLNSLLQSTVLPLLNTEIRLFGKQKRSKLEEKVKALG